MHIFEGSKLLGLCLLTKKRIKETFSLVMGEWEAWRSSGEDPAFQQQLLARKEAYYRYK